MVNLLILLIFHILGDFYLQTSKIAKCKNAYVEESCNTCNKCKKNSFVNNKFLLLHTFLYIVPFFLLFCTTKWTSALFIIAMLLFSHYAIDIVSCYLNKRIKQCFVFVFDQALHIAILLETYFLFEFDSTFFPYQTIIKIIFSVLLLAVPSSVFINKLFCDLFPQANQGKIFEVGSIIGMFERALAFIFACFGNFAAIAIIISIKTWARTNDLKDHEFRNKFLLGTLASLVFSLIAFLIYNL